MPTKKNGNKISAEKVFGVWQCPDCKQLAEWTYQDFVSCGGPVCDDCNTEMEFTGEMGIRGKKG